ncbi:MAG: indole-3-glycerol phosphate synthase TrpC [Rectinemataceae bacterium]
MSGPGILGAIASERAADVRLAKKSRPEASLSREASAPRPLFRGGGGVVLIAECKRASPSRGLLVERYESARIAAAYERGGANAISVLTEPRHFLGSDADLSAVRAATGLPVLRKDFIVDAYQIREAWAIGADALLLIAALLDRTRIAEFAACARALGMETLLEIHGEEELELAAAAADLVDAVGVNSRELSSFAMDASRPSRLAARLDSILPRGLRRVAESGLRSGDEAAALRRLGYDAFLVGEHFVTAEDPEETVREFVARVRAASPGREPAIEARASGVGLAGTSEGGPQCARE